MRESLRKAVPGPTGSGSPRLMDQVRQALRARHYSRRTEQAYCHWVRRFVYFNDVRHPAGMGEKEINLFLTHLAVREHVSASTQNQALAAILFLYRSVLGREIGNLDVVRARRPVRLPVVMSREEVRCVLEHLRGDKLLAASLMYGSGLRLMEVLQMRVQDIDLVRHEITVRDGKGSRDRITMLPRFLVDPLRSHLNQVKEIHEKDLSDGWGKGSAP